MKMNMILNNNPIFVDLEKEESNISKLYQL
jgi:hypothetical protein